MWQLVVRAVDWRLFFFNYPVIFSFLNVFFFFSFLMDTCLKVCCYIFFFFYKYKYLLRLMFRSRTFKVQFKPDYFIGIWCLFLFFRSPPPHTHTLSGNFHLFFYPNTEASRKKKTWPVNWEVFLFYEIKILLPKVCFKVKTRGHRKCFP